jgi:hypothetical protein
MGTASANARQRARYQADINMLAGALAKKPNKFNRRDSSYETEINLNLLDMNIL